MGDQVSGYESARGGKPATLARNDRRPDTPRTAGNAAMGALLGSAQRRTEVGPSDDPLESRADTIADSVVRAVLGRSPGPARSNTTAAAVLGQRIQRTASIGAEGGQLDPSTDRALQSARQGGKPLDGALRPTLEAAIGADLGGVRLHDGAAASDLSEHMQARAFTVGGDVFFRDGLPDTSQPAGLQLLAHELAHTVQQGAASSTIHRDLDSAETLTELVQPKVFEGPTVDVQKDLVVALEAKFEQVRDPFNLLNLSCLGGIFIDNLDPDAKLNDLIDKAELIDLPTNGPYKRNVGMSTWKYVDDQMKQQVIVNTLTTMDQAGQLDYLRKAGLVNQQWTILVEVHYYRERDKNAQKFHKDTTGQTLFVNLNFISDTPLPGPEVIVNPNREGDEFNSRTDLPPIFKEDLIEALSGTGLPEVIEHTVIPKNGVVAFVDEAVHHKSPTVGHRTVSVDDIRHALEDKYGAEYTGAVTAYRNYQSRWTDWWDFSSYFKDVAVERAQSWYRVLSQLEAEPDRTFDRTQVAGLLVDGEVTLDIDALIDEGGNANFREASIPVPGKQALKIPVSRKDQPRLKRTMSQLALDELPVAPPGKRTFFRTWVRAVPRVVED